MFAIPDAFTFAVNRFHPVIGNGMNLTVLIHNLKTEVILWIKNQLAKGYPHQIFFEFIKISHFKFCGSILAVPANTIEQIVYRLHKGS